MWKELPPDFRHAGEPSFLHQVVQDRLDLVLYCWTLLFDNNNVLYFLGELPDDFRLKRICYCGF